MEDKKEYRCPSVAVDLIINCYSSERGYGLVFIERKNPPYGYALPGGFVDYGEATYDAAVREAKEETGLDIYLKRQLFTYSNPKRDPRQHVVSVAYVASSVGEPVAADDAKAIVWVYYNELDRWLEDNKEKFVCDHYHILKDYLSSDRGFITYINPEAEIERWK